MFFKDSVVGSLILFVFWINFGSSCADGLFGFDVHHRYSDAVKDFLDLEGLPEKNSPDYFAAMAHRDHLSKARRLATTPASSPFLTFIGGNETYRLSSLGLMSKPSPPRWVSIRRPATAMTPASGGVAGGGWEYPESPPTPPRRRWHTCRPEKWGSLRRAPLFPKQPESASLPVPHPPSSNPPPMPHVSPSQISTSASVSGYCPLDSPHIGGDPVAGEEVVGESSGADDGLTQACVEANLEVKIQMKQMGLYCSDSDDD